MKQVDCMIVGAGLAGCALYWRLKQLQISCLLIDINEEQSCSKVAAGMFNPMVAKRFTTSWKSDLVFHQSPLLYQFAEEQTQSSFFHQLPLFMPFQSVMHQNEWSLKEDSMKHWILDDSATDLKSYYHIPYHGLTINYSGYLNSAYYISQTINYAIQQNEFLNDKFVYEKLDRIHKKYQEFCFQSLVFCEGNDVVNNPLVTIPFLRPAKGELIQIETKLPIPNIIYNGKLYIIPQTSNRLIVGATYDWNYTSHLPTDIGLEYLQSHLSEIVKFDYQLVSHQAAVRPTVIDRRPVLSELEKDIYIFNGLGTKGVILSPYLAEILIQKIIHLQSLPEELSINRFIK